MEPAIAAVIVAAIYIPIKPSAWPVVALTIIAASIFRIVIINQNSGPSWIHGLNAAAAGISVMNEAPMQAVIIGITAAVVVSVSATHDHEHSG